MGNGMNCKCLSKDERVATIVFEEDEPKPKLD
jgi:hypothetical protein